MKYILIILLFVSCNRTTESQIERQRRYNDIIMEFAKPLMDSLQNDNRAMDKVGYEHLPTHLRLRYQSNCDSYMILLKLQGAALYTTKKID